MTLPFAEKENLTPAEAGMRKQKFLEFGKIIVICP